MAAIDSAMTHDALADVLGKGVQAAMALSAHLSAERAALESEDLDALHRAAAAKAEVLSLLEALENDRRALLDRHGYADDAHGMARLTQDCGSEASLDDTWQHYLAVASDCQRANQVNGAIIRLRQQHLSDTLKVLTGAGRAATYGPQGADPVKASRSMGEA